MRRWAKPFLVVGLVLGTLSLGAQTPAETPPEEAEQTVGQAGNGSEEPSATALLAEAVRAHVRGQEREILGELVQLLELPNVASDGRNIRRNAELLVAMLERRGLAARAIDGEGGPPVVFGELRTPGARRTVMFYAHYDGQPVDPAAWSTAPWNPTLLDAEGQPLRAAELAESLDGEWRLHARSASDDKGPIVALLTALDALAAVGEMPSVNLKFFFEGEEEASSPHLADVLRRNAELLAADVMIFCDGPVHPSRRPQVVFGVRGVRSLELVVYGAERSLHSGHYGNWAPNPALQLADLVASLRDPDGRVMIGGFYDRVRPISEAEKVALGALPEVEPALRHELGIARSEAGDARLGERIALPAFNVRGLASGAVGAAAKNAIPTEARASIDLRLVPDQTPESVRRAIEEHLDRAGWHRVDTEPDAETRRLYPRIIRLEWDQGYPPARTALELPISQAVLGILDQALAEPVLRVPTLGGSLPLYLFEEHLGVPFLVVPMANHDNNQHAPNENLRLQNLWDGIVMYAVLMAELGERW